MAEFLSSLENHHIRVGRRWTNVRLEPEVWSALCDIAVREGVEVYDLCAQIAEDRSHGTLTSALRLYALQYWRRNPARQPEFRGGLPTVIQSWKNLRMTTDERDFVVRQDQTLDALMRCDPGMGGLFSYWRSLTAGGQLARFEAFDLAALAHVGFVDHVHLIDVEAGDPKDFRIIRQAPKAMIYKQSTDGYPLRAFGDNLYARELAEDYSRARTEGRPILQQITAKSSYGVLTYWRLMLPATDGDGVQRLIVGVILPPA